MQGFHVDILAHKHQLVLAPSQIEETPHFVPTGKNRIGCVLLDSKTHLRISAPALKLLSTLPVNRDAIGDVSWWKCDDGKTAFSWIGALYRVIDTRTAEAARGFQIFDGAYTLIPNRIPKSVLEGIAKTGEEGYWREPLSIDPPVRLGKNDLVLNHCQIYRWGTAQMHFRGPEEKLAQLEDWIKQHIPSKYAHVEAPFDTDYGKRNRSFTLDLTAWTFLCSWWTGFSHPHTGVPWVLRQGTPQFSGQSSSVEFSLGLLSITASQLHKDSNNEAIEPEITEAIETLRKLENKVRQRLPKRT